MAASPRRQGTGNEASSLLPGSSYHQPGGMHPLSSVATGALGHHHQPHSGSPGAGLRPMVVQSDFRKVSVACILLRLLLDDLMEQVSGISTEIFRQIETVENDHDATTAAALEAVERRGEMLVRVLDPRNMGRAASEAARSFLAVQVTMGNESSLASCVYGEDGVIGLPTAIDLITEAQTGDPLRSIDPMRTNKRTE